MERLGDAVAEINVSLKSISHPGAPVDFMGSRLLRANPAIKPEGGPVG
jgi:hypothetical protein